MTVTRFLQKHLYIKSKPRSDRGGLKSKPLSEMNQLTKSVLGRMSGTTSERNVNEARLLIVTKPTHNRTLERMALVKCMNIRPL